jgi:hypothetical protein
MSIGDVHSEERGSGARFNTGKTDLTLLPPACWETIAEDTIPEHHFLKRELGFLAEFWEGNTELIFTIMDELSAEDLILAAEVFEYGARKYAKWNWAKGMPWSVPMACYLRHTLLADDPYDPDEESGISHRGHAVCNLVMLATYAVLCADMDDRPQELTPEFHQAEESYPEEEDPRTPEHIATRHQDLVEDEVDPTDYPHMIMLGDSVMSVVDLPTSVLNDLVEVAVEEQEYRGRVLRTTGYF